jgi:hypothetical protein
MIIEKYEECQQKIPPSTGVVTSLFIITMMCSLLRIKSHHYFIYSNEIIRVVFFSIFCVSIVPSGRYTSRHYQGQHESSVAAGKTKKFGEAGRTEPLDIQ